MRAALAYMASPATLDAKRRHGLDVLIVDYIGLMAGLDQKQSRAYQIEEISRGLKAGEVANWEIGKNAAVAFTYEVDELPATIERRWSPNSWTLTTYDGSVIDLAKDEGNGALADLALHEVSE